MQIAYNLMILNEINNYQNKIEIIQKLLNELKTFTYKIIMHLYILIINNCVI